MTPDAAHRTFFAGLDRVCVACLAVDDHIDALFAEERALVARAAPKRQRQFATGRLAAHILFDAVGAARRPILTTVGRAPDWGPDWVGSISHTDRWAVAALAARRHVRGLGIDIEARGRLTQKLLRMILTPGEIASCGHGADLDRALVIFSAKESIYKAVQPVVGGYIGFQDVEIDVGNGRFSAYHVGKRAIGGLIDGGAGHFEAADDVVASLFIVP